MTRTKMKKVIAMILALAASAALAVGGTLAYLTHQTETVKNTFVAGHIFENDEDFKLLEHKAELQADSTHKLGTVTVKENKYVVTPNIPIAKDPYLDSSGKATGEGSYIFVEVCSKLPSGLGYSIDDSIWARLYGIRINQYGEAVENLTNGIIGPNDGTVYCLKSENGSNIISSGTVLSASNTNILKDKQITVDPDFDGTKLTDDKNTLTFYGYACQSSGFKSPLEAWNANFASPASSGN